MGAPLHDQEIACQQVLVEDSSVFSIQWSVFPACLATELSPETLLSRYLVLHPPLYHLHYPTLHDADRRRIPPARHKAKPDQLPAGCNRGYIRGAAHLRRFAGAAAPV